MDLSKEELKEFLDERADKYNCARFIESDPISIPHRYLKKEDIEISGFLTATISWGSRKAIIKSSTKMMELFDDSPFDFVINHEDSDLRRLDGFVHRTFNSYDLNYFLKALRNIYIINGGMENIFETYKTKDSLQYAIHKFKSLFFDLPHHTRTTKHIADPLNGSAGKRMNMYLRWLVRKDRRGVDFGLWKTISPSILSCPLDVHTGNVARKLGLLKRKQNDAKAVIELDNSLRRLDPVDPVKYDFALFGLGVFESF